MEQSKYSAKMEEERAKHTKEDRKDKSFMNKNRKRKSGSNKRLASVIGYVDKRMFGTKSRQRIISYNSGPQVPGENNGVTYFGSESENNADEKVDKLLFGKLHIFCE